MRLMTLPPFVLFLLTLTACPLPDDTADTDAPDCNDVDESGEPGHPARLFYLDGDGDDFGSTAVYLCHDPFELRPDSYSAFGGDCNDDDDDVHPGADEVCDGIDNDCDGDIDGGALDAVRWYADNDNDGYGEPSWGPLQCERPEGHVDNGPSYSQSSDFYIEIWAARGTKTYQ